MFIYPAIDIRGGRCVRLRQGDYAQETVFGDDPASMASKWVSEGAKALHLVDLDGAKDKRPVNGPSIRAITQAVDVPCQLGGGLREESHVREAREDWGLERVIIGSKAVSDPDWLGELSEKYPGRIILGIDAKDGKVATDGWLNVSEVTAVQLAQLCERFPLAGLIYTDIARDGMMSGPNLPAMAEMAGAVRTPVIASGGVTELEHVRLLAEAGLSGAIIGRALYEGHLELSAVLEVAGEAKRGA